MIVPEGLEFKLRKERKGFTNKWISKQGNNTYLKKQDSEIVYQSIDNGDWYCTSCGSEILGATVNHSLHDPNFTCAGGGQIIREIVPYCPKCEKVPNNDGSPCYESLADLF